MESDIKPGTREKREAEYEHKRRWVLGNESALDFLDTIGHLSQIADDFADGDLPEERRHAAMADLLHLSMVKIPTNSFYQGNLQVLSPFIATWIGQWDLSNRLESAPDETSLMWSYVMRDVGSHLIYLCAHILGGYDHARNVMTEVHEFYFVKHGETFEDWRGDL